MAEYRGRTHLACAGDRFFFPNYPDLGIYRQPRQLDARVFQFQPTADGARLHTEFEIKHAKQARRFKLWLDKAIGPAANPLRHEKAWSALGKVAFAGYEVRTRLEFATPAAPNVPVGLWHLIQMPHGGDMLLPGYGGAKPKVVFGKVPPGDVTGLAHGGVRYRMTAKGEQKISLRAAS